MVYQKTRRGGCKSAYEQKPSQHTRIEGRVKQRENPRSWSRICIGHPKMKMKILMELYREREAMRVSRNTDTGRGGL